MSFSSAFSTSRPADSAYQDLSKTQFKTCRDGISRSAETEGQDLSKRHPRKIKNINNNTSYPENSPSIRPAQARETDHDGQADEDAAILEDIFDRCELELFQPNIRTMLRNAIERLYYSDTLKIGNARLPQAKVRSYLSLLDSDSVMAALDSMKRNEQHIVNPTAYLMSTLFNSICEKESGLILNLPPDYVSSNDLYIPAESDWREVEDDAPE